MDFSLQMVSHHQLIHQNTYQGTDKWCKDRNEEPVIIHPGVEEKWESRCNQYISIWLNIAQHVI